ncbi:alpha-(1,3)-fucosyltransferase C-like [Chelonus insularis]|uniref:alpha-(1,3)-fucosyltransferase C-like n=1 Tax=Chelonus insularis TaxID=460826 RepID=UPI00158C0826|nr:alpha-(1,3)-fucosyltransferase C-like [Chelonus insularis]XP_034935391.1 alpha-(1,3)-fucosyltransferase C-like [Chelonus insularis]XP_034935392.1 alpha-(1,3)-fucosyltransferase C-like [Chelonus insularis]
MQLCNRIKRFWLLMSLFAIGSLYLLSIYFDLNSESWRSGRLFFGIDNKTPLPQGLNDSTKLVLFWNTMFGDETFYFGRGDVFENCPNIPKGSCYATHNRYAANVENFDAILFHGNELDIGDLPKKRRPHQRYIFTNLESPVNRPLPYPFFENYFNLTMTYRLDSDIVWPYSLIREKATGEILWPLHQTTVGKTSSATGNTMKAIPSSNVTQLIRKKKKTAVWFVSNCNSMSGREKYVDELEKYIDVDIYGFCGQKSCKRDQDCFKTVIEPNYFFYLSFENSLCQDYVTEKLYNALKHYVVPVVYGGANYSLFAPPDSYINTMDFESPLLLAKYLKKLTKEPKEYAKYFEWKHQYEAPSSPLKFTICQLCRYLLEDHKPKTYDPLSSWYKYNKCPLQEKLNFLPYLTKSALN